MKTYFAAKILTMVFSMPSLGFASYFSHQESTESLY